MRTCSDRMCGAGDCGLCRPLSAGRDEADTRVTDFEDILDADPVAQAYLDAVAAGDLAAIDLIGDLAFEDLPTRPEIRLPAPPRTPSDYEFGPASIAAMASAVDECAHNNWNAVRTESGRYALHTKDTVRPSREPK